MTCDSVRDLIHALVDDELDAARRSDVESHISGCIGCAEAHHKLAELRRSIRGDAPYFKAPDQLAARIRVSLRSAARAEQPRRVPWAWISAAASLAFAAALAWGIVVLRSKSVDRDLLAQEIVSSHVRSLMPGHLLDVPSSDQHTVKPWFAGKLDFSPKVKDLSPSGFPLTGGRLDYIEQRPVAALVFHRRQHIINLFVWPSPKALSGGPVFSMNGFNIIQWADGGLTYWAVSDLNGDDLREFVRLYRQ